MDSSINKTLNIAILKLLRPLVRILLRNGISFHVFGDLARWVYADVAYKEFGIKEKKQTISRVSVITGLSRKEVQKLRQLEFPGKEDIHERYNRATRVISGWIRDPLFTDQEGNPLPLPPDGSVVSFNSLVRRFSGDMPVRAVFDELLNVGAIDRQKDGTIKLLTRAYLPGADKLAKINILGEDVADLISTINHNLETDNATPFFQRKVSYDNVSTEVLDQFNQLSARESQALLEKLDRWLAVRDRDANPEVKGSGRKRVGLGIYYFEEDLDEPL
ncbi:MAG: hypothetical protein KKB30_00475 [Proteobacteria bacterium]|nr:hypothetical protein [Pseudomonadota bacterium]MBU1716690.1 hypothetical protein [Pseudomonadota bacterium]